MIKKWKELEFESCNMCSGTLQAYTEEPDGFFRDGDKVRCTDCTFSSMVSVDEDGSAWVQQA